MPRDAQGGATPSTATATAVAVIKAYALPLFLLSLSLFFQLVVLPRAFPPSHYDVLEIERHSPIEVVEDAYQKLSTKWTSGNNIPSVGEFLEVRYAYEILSNPLWKRDYDSFGIDENLHIIESAKKQYNRESFMSVKLPLIEATSCDFEDGPYNLITSENWGSTHVNSSPWLLLVYSRASSRCMHLYELWRQIAHLLDGVANSSLVELGDSRLAMFIAERKPTGQLFYRSGLPSVISLPAGCGNLDCTIRYGGEITVDGITDWFATTILKLPRILYYTKDSLAKWILEKNSRYKVKVIVFSKTGQRASPFVRQTAKTFWAHATFAFVLWRDEDFSFWWNSFEVDFAPAIVIIKDPGVKPIVVHGSLNNSMFSDIIETHKQPELAQLRSLSSMQLGCDARGHSRAGNDTLSWYCLILAGRLSPELDTMRGTMCRLQRELLEAGEPEDPNREHYSNVATALREKRLTFAWLDGEVQARYCFFYLHSETSYETCGPRKDLNDVPRLVIVRYKKNSTEERISSLERSKNIWYMLQEEDKDPVSQLVARYNGSNELSQIMKWISDTIRDGDTRDLPLFRAKTPDLVPDYSEPIWSRGSQRFSFHSLAMKNSLKAFLDKFSDYLQDPRIGPMLLLGAVASFGTIWLLRNQSCEAEGKDDANRENLTSKRPVRRRREMSLEKKDIPPSMTDIEPKDAYQMHLSDSGSD